VGRAIVFSREAKPSAVSQEGRGTTVSRRILKKVRAIGGWPARLGDFAGISNRAAGAAGARDWTKGRRDWRASCICLRKLEGPENIGRILEEFPIFSSARGAEKIGDCLKTMRFPRRCAGQA
jgi:hypothetical protein